MASNACATSTLRIAAAAAAALNRDRSFIDSPARSLRTRDVFEGSGVGVGRDERNLHLEVVADRIPTRCGWPVLLMHDDRGVRGEELERGVPGFPDAELAHRDDVRVSRRLRV